MTKSREETKTNKRQTKDQIETVTSETL